jgi:hypothetical protein
MKLLILVVLLFASVFAGKVTDLLKTELGLRGGKADILIQLQKQVDFSQVRDEKGTLAADIENEDARGYLVMNTVLKNVSKLFSSKKMRKLKNL